MASMEFVKPLGKGSYGSVNLIKFNKHDGSKPHYHAVKSSFAHDFDSLYNEFQIISKLRDCPGIVRTFGTSLSRGVNDHGNRVYGMSMEYAAGGSLTSFMETRSLTDTMIRDFTRMILEGLVSVHDHGYVHCDLKPDNILGFPRDVNGGVTKEVSYELKISDFGMSTEAGEGSVFWEFDSPYLGTPLYMSPESVHYGVAEKSLDLWSLGCVVLEMYTGKPPWPFQDSKEFLRNLLDDKAPEVPESVPWEARQWIRPRQSPWPLQDSEEILRHLLDGKAPEVPESLPWEARQFIETCFARNPVERGSALDMLKHQFLLSDEKKVMVTVAGSRRKSVAVVLKSEDIMKKPLRLKIIPPKPPQFKKVENRPLRLKIIPPKPPGCNLVSVQ
uniref:Protein kinase domain-containing protein n=1 Tax=Brassica oleracea var. oleracea TaxID=109376 RepID=A0A0D3BT06_BRAOL